MTYNRNSVALSHDAAPRTSPLRIRRALRSCASATALLLCVAATSIVRPA